MDVREGDYLLAVDGISVPLVFLSAFIYLTGITTTWYLKKREKEFFLFLGLLVTGVFGVFVSLVGLDPTTGSARYTFGEMSLLSGVAFLPALIGLFAVGQVLTDAEEILKRQIGKCRRHADNSLM